MYRDKVFEEIRNELITKFQQIDFHEFPKFHEWATPHYKILEQLAELNRLEITVKPEIFEDDNLENDLESNSIPIEENNLPYPIGHVFTVDKKAFGAVLSELNYPLPEALIRDMGIENGNKVKIIGHKGNFHSGAPRWDMEIVDHASIPVPGLIEVFQGIVKKISHTLVVNQTVGGGSIWVNDSPATLYINESDKSRYDIKEGDIIDGRFYENNVTGSFRVTYKHDIEEAAQSQSIESRRLHYRKNNSMETEAGINMLERLDKQPLLNRNIVLVGLEGRKNDFSSNLKGSNIQLTHLTGDEKKTSIRSTLKKADYVLISTFENSHDASKFTAKTCKELNVPCTHTHADGLHGVLMDALELIRCVEENKAV